MANQIRSQSVLVQSNEDRGAIVEAIKGSPAGEMSASQIARQLGKSCPNIAHHCKRLAKGEVLEVSRIEIPERGSPMAYYRFAPGFLRRVPDEVVLDSLAAHLRSCNGSADVEKIRGLVRETGRRVSEAEPDPRVAPDKMLRPSAPAVPLDARRLREMKRLPLGRRERCACEGTVADGEGHCLSCSKPKGEAASVRRLSDSGEGG